MHCIYLHGFASGPSSTKSIFFSRKIEELGMVIDVPDLNLPTFESMTLSSQLEFVEQSLRGKTNVLVIGSSMGGLIASLAAAKNDNIKGLILLAPGFGLSRRWQTLWSSEQFFAWEKTGYLEVFHHARKAPAKLGYQFMRDAALHDCEDIRIQCPALVLHGSADAVVPVSESIRFRDLNLTFVDLEILEDDHQLLRTLPQLWQHSHRFIKMLTANHK